MDERRTRTGGRQLGPQERTNRRPAPVWVQIRNDYVFGVHDSGGERSWPSAKELADRYDIPLSSVARAVSKGIKGVVEGNWQPARDAFVRRLADEAERLKIKRSAAEFAKADDRHIREATIIENNAFMAMMEMEPDPSDPSGRRMVMVQPPRFKTGLSTEGIARLAKVWALAVDKLRLVRGLPAEITEVHVSGDVEVRDELPPEIRALPTAVRSQALKRLADVLAHYQSEVVDEDERRNRVPLMLGAGDGE